MKKNFLLSLIKKYLYVIFMCLFSAIFLVCAGLLTDYFIQSAKQHSQYNELSDLVQQVQQAQQNQQNSGGNTGNSGNTGNTDNSGNTTQTPVSPYTTVINPKTQQEMEVLTEYAPIYKLNSDTVGWIYIEGTKVNYPVLQTPDWVNYYLTRDFNGNTAKHGAIYVNELASVNDPVSDNVTIYGHKMKDGSMFASLHEYKKQSFYQAHPYITFDTLFEHHTYQILAVFITTATVDGFGYHNFVDGDVQAFEEFVATCKELSLYDTGVDATYGDKLITLSTCEHGIADGRLAVVAKRIS